MIRLLIVLFWLTLIVGTCVAGNVVGNWIVCLLALFFFVRSRRRREPRGTLSDGAPATQFFTRRSSAGPLSSHAGVPLPPVAQDRGPVQSPRPRWR